MADYPQMSGSNNDWAGYTILISEDSINVSVSTVPIPYINQQPIYGDVDNDGVTEVVLLRDADEPPANNARIYVLSLPDLTIERTIVPADDIWVYANKIEYWTSGAIADINNDGQYELYTSFNLHGAPGNNYIAIINLSNGKSIAYFTIGGPTDSPLQVALGCSEANNQCGYFYMAGAVTTDYDTTLDFMLINSTNFSHLHTSTTLTGAGSFKCFPTLARPAVGDYDADGQDEFIMSILEWGFGALGDYATIAVMDISGVKEKSFYHELDVSVGGGACANSVLSGSSWNMTYIFSSPMLLDIDDIAINKPEIWVVTPRKELGVNGWYGTGITAFRNDGTVFDEYPQNDFGIYTDDVIPCSFISTPWNGGWLGLDAESMCYGCFNTHETSTYDEGFTVVCANTGRNKFLGVHQQEMTFIRSLQDESYKLMYPSWAGYYDQSDNKRGWYNNMFINEYTGSSYGHMLTTPFGLMIPDYVLYDSPFLGTKIWVTHPDYRVNGYSGPWLTPLEYSGVDGLAVSDASTFTAITGNAANINCDEEPCIRYLETNPSINDVICTNTTVTVAFRVIDDDGNNVNANFSAYYGDVNEQKYNYSAVDYLNGKYFIYSFKANKTGNNYQLVMNAYESGEPAYVETINEFYFTVADTSCSGHGDSLFKWDPGSLADSLDAQADNATMPTVPNDNVVENVLDKFTDYTGIGTSILWLLITIILCVSIILQPGEMGLKFGLSTMVASFMIVLGVALGFIGFVYIVLMVIAGLVVLAVSFAGIFNGKGGG